MPNEPDLGPASELGIDVLQFIQSRTSDRTNQAAACAIALGMLLARAPDLEKAAEYFKRMIKHVAQMPGL